MTARAAVRPGHAPYGLAHDVWVLAGRNLRLSLAIRDFVALVASPLMFFTGFYVVLHKLLAARGLDFGQFLPSAIIVQSTGFAAFSTAFFLVADRRRGMLARCRSMPISPASVLIARLAADAARVMVVVLVIVGAGFLTGFRFTAGPLAAAGFFLLSLAFPLTLAAGAAAVGLGSPRPDAVAAGLFLAYQPPLHLSTTFVPAGVFPAWLQPIVTGSPVSAVVTALRALSGGGQTAAPLWHAAAWLTGMAIVFGWAASRSYRRAL
jgi:ABC-2 type transport system permease protein